LFAYISCIRTLSASILATAAQMVFDVQVQITFCKLVCAIVFLV